MKKKTTTTTKGQEKGSGKLGNVRPEGDREWGLMVNNHNRIDDLFRKGQDKAALALFDRLKGQRDGDNRSVLLRKTWHLILQKSARSEDAGNEATAKDLYRAYRDMCITDLQQQRQQHQRQQESSPPASVAAVDNMGEGYNIYMKRFSRSLKVDKVLSIFEDMKQVRAFGRLYVSVYISERLGLIK